MFNRRGMINDYSSLGAYVFVGMGATMFKPHLELDETRPGDKYKDNMGVTMAFPIGVGLKYIISDKWVFGYEIGYRQTFSDFLDGFKSPSSNRPDVYWISTFNLSYRIATSRRGLPIFMDRNWRRARF
jgi:opacity protein-like surface antigen